MDNAKTKTLTSGLMHGLKFCLKNDSGYDQEMFKTYTLDYMSKDVNGNIVIHSIETKQPFKLYEMSIYLFPMSSLTKKIEFGGKRFVPLLKMWGERKGFDHKESSFRTFEPGRFEITYKQGSMLNMIVNINVNRIDQLMFWQVEWLIEHHFNVFGLSPEEFIEVNETNNPYKV